MEKKTQQRKKLKSAAAPQMRLTQMEKISLRNNREVLRDMGLKMPRITPKYWLAIKLISAKDSTSIVFYHIHAARKGQQVFYTELKKSGYAWQKGKWVRVKKKPQ